MGSAEPYRNALTEDGAATRDRWSDHCVNKLVEIRLPDMRVTKKENSG
jgi:hypothetical protein